MPHHKVGTRAQLEQPGYWTTLLISMQQGKTDKAIAECGIKERKRQTQLRNTQMSFGVWSQEGAHRRKLSSSLVSLLMSSESLVKVHPKKCKLSAFPSNGANKLYSSCQLVAVLATCYNVAVIKCRSSTRRRSSKGCKPETKVVALATVQIGGLIYQGWGLRDLVIFVGTDEAKKSFGVLIGQHASIVGTIHDAVGYGETGKMLPT